HAGPDFVEVIVRQVFLDRVMHHDRFYMAEMQARRMELERAAYLASAAGNFGLLQSTRREMDDLRLRQGWVQTRMGRYEAETARLKGRSHGFPGGTNSATGLYKGISSALLTHENAGAQADFQRHIKKQVELQSQFAGVVGGRVGEIRADMAAAKSPQERLAFRKNLDDVMTQLSAGKGFIPEKDRKLGSLVSKLAAEKDPERAEKLRDELRTDMGRLPVKRDRDHMGSEQLVKLTGGLSRVADPAKRMDFEKQAKELQESIQKRKEIQESKAKLDTLAERAGDAGRGPDRNREVVNELQNIVTKQPPVEGAKDPLSVLQRQIHNDAKQLIERGRPEPGRPQPTPDTMKKAQPEIPSGGTVPSAPGIIPPGVRPHVGGEPPMPGVVPGRHPEDGSKPGMRGGPQAPPGTTQPSLQPLVPGDRPPKDQGDAGRRGPEPSKGQEPPVKLQPQPAGPDPKDRPPTTTLPEGRPQDRLDRGKPGQEPGRRPEQVQPPRQPAEGLKPPEPPKRDQPQPVVRPEDVRKPAPETRPAPVRPPVEQVRPPEPPKRDTAPSRRIDESVRPKPESPRPPDVRRPEIQRPPDPAPAERRVAPTPQSRQEPVRRPEQVMPRPERSRPEADRPTPPREIRREPSPEPRTQPAERPREPRPQVQPERQMPKPSREERAPRPQSVRPPEPAQAPRQMNRPSEPSSPGGGRPQPGPQPPSRPEDRGAGGAQKK
ncbi:MAG: hypothetical protein V2B18_19340, partial [Pseudomonadota bacterium]